MPTSQIENIAYEKFTQATKALLIRDYWKEKLKERKYIFDFPEEENDPWIISKKSIFEELLKEKILKEWPEQKDFHERIGIILVKNIDTFYKETIYQIFPWEFRIEKQDEWTRSLLAKLLENYPEDSILNIFLAFDTPEKLEEYITVSNPILSLLRIEYEGYIHIEKMHKFGYRKTWFYQSNWEVKMQILKNITQVKPTKNEDHKKRINFNKASGEVFFDDISLGVIDINNFEYFFFEILYDNYGLAIPHQKISDYLREKWKTVNARTDNKNTSEVNLFCSWVKSKINWEIKKYIYSPKGHYQLREII